jgi:O-antigen ligase
MIVVSISAVHMYLGPLQYTRPSLTLLLLAVVAAMVRPSSVRWSNIVNSWPAIVVVGLLGMALLSAGLGLSTGGSLQYIIEKYSKVLIFFFVMVAAMRNVRDLAVLVWAFVCSVGIVIVLSLTVLELRPTHDGLGRLDGGAMMFDANDIGMILLMCLPLTLMLLYNSRKLGRWVATFVLCGIPVVIALTGSRGALLGLAATLPMIFVVLRRISIFTRALVGAGLLVTLAVAAPPGYWQQMSTILNPSQDYNTSDEYGRIGIAKRGWGYMLRYPIAGVGIANFARAEGTISPIAQQRAMAGLSVQWIAPHNTYVQVGAELGIPGLVLWLTLLWGGSVGTWRLRSQIPRRWEWESADRRFLREATLFLPISFVAFAITSFFLTHAFTPPIYIFIAYHAAIVLFVRRELRADRRQRRQINALAAVPVATSVPARRAAMPGDLTVSTRP